MGAFRRAAGGRVPWGALARPVGAGLVVQSWRKREALRERAVATAIGGQHGGGAALTPAGERIIELYRTIEGLTRTSAHEESRAIARLVRRGERRRVD